MTKLEVNAKVAKAIEHLRLAKPGHPATERATHRNAANQIMGELTMTDLRKIDDDLCSLLTEYA